MGLISKTIAMLAFGFALLCASHGIAEEAPDTKERAQAVFRQGRSAFKQRDFKRALDLFIESQRIHPAPGTRINIALAQKELGKLAEALALLEEIVAVLPPDDERMPIAKQHHDTLMLHVPRLRIDLAPAAPEGTAVSFDGVVLTMAQLGVQRRVNPGGHVVVVTAPERLERRYDLQLEPGSDSTVLVEAGEVPPDEPPPIVVTEESGEGEYVGGLILLGLGLASGVAGGITGSQALNLESELDSRCPEPAQCTDEGVDLAEDGNTLSIVSTVTFAAGAVGVGAGIYLLVAAGEARSAAEPSENDLDVTVAASPLPGGGWVGIGGRF